MELIGRGAYSKVKRVVREYTEGGVVFHDEYAMKVNSLNVNLSLCKDDAQADTEQRARIKI